MKAVIVAGGKGERMIGYTSDIPKPMIKVANKPILEHQIEFLRKNGIKEIYILLGYLGAIIKDYFGNGNKFGVSIEYFQENLPLGTAGCVKQLDGVLYEDFLIVYGDLVFDMKIDDFIFCHKKKGGCATLVAHPNDHPYDSDLVITDENNKITGFIQKNCKPEYYRNLVSAAIYAISPAVFKYIKEEKCDFINDVFPTMLAVNEKLYAYKTSEYIRDMGTIDRLERVNRDYADGKVGKFLKKNKRAAIFMDRDGTLVEKHDFLYKMDDLKLFTFTTQAMEKINNSDFLGIVITNQPVVARGLCDISTVQKIHDKLETLLGRERVYVNDIYFCPHHQDGGYEGENPSYKIDCNCRKPKTGLLEQAISDYNIDIESSWFVGDTTRDIQTGINMGIKTILVKTGDGGMDGRFDVHPSHTCNNILEAVDLILSNS